MYPSQITAGSCYRTPRNAVYHVIEITADDHVIFKTRNGSQEPNEKNWLPGAPADRLPRLINFAHSVIQEVPIDWNPATGDLVPTPPPAGTELKPVAPEPIGARPEA